ncbi:ASC1-like protein 3 [Physcomitrium patens]|uniref:TLC domain-containing protein n=1 Tax=Physcomitrium patens TaxID=3218 RepID=A0A2K1IIW1_PHYPA|nr:ASC1-like protein 3 [Physcomitrium patens]PNR29212.1 hypothetical protein PHYPA_027904 [Physcomitrium patens]|eukprot:XP_024361685.1 ASC1-like protein 3 [Physcomitrella patens]
MVSIWETERPPSVQDYYLVCYFALAFPVARFLLDCFLYQKLARWCIFPHGVKGLKNGAREAGEKKIPKFTESAWKLTYYLATEVFVIFITYKEAWFGNTSAFWHGWPYQTVKFQLTLFYTFQCGFYIYSVAALLFWETRRKDFDVMMTHHIVTIGLIAYSYITGSFRAGSIVLALHDVSDVFMEAAKLCKYSGSEVGASVSFGLFVLSWVLLRLIYFPFWIIWSTSYEVINYVDLSQFYVSFQYYVFNMLLITLLVIHCYWWVLILRMVIKQLRNSGKVGEDVRSDSEDG